MHKTFAHDLCCKAAWDHGQQLVRTFRPLPTLPGPPTNAQTPLGKPARAEWMGKGRASSKSPALSLSLALSLPLSLLFRRTTSATLNLDMFVDTPGQHSPLGEQSQNNHKTITKQSTKQSQNK